MASVVYPIFELPMHGGSDGLTPADARDRRYWDVVLDGSDSNAKNIALAATGIPALGDAFPGQNAGYCVLRRSADPHSESKYGKVYRVMVEYGINPLITSGSNSAPWLRDKLVNWGSVRYDEVLHEDYDSTPVAVLNSAEDPFDPPIMTYKYNRLATIRYAKLAGSFDPDAASALEGTLNQSTVTFRGATVAAEKALLHEVQASDNVWTDSNRYWDISVKIEVERQRVLKNPKILNAGYHCFRSGQKDFCRIKNLPASTPQRLDASGAQLADADASTYKQFVQHPTASWTALGL